MDTSESNYITLGNATFHYYTYGSGEKVLFCFHGYGREGSSFSFLQSSLGHLYTIVAIDMPFHGLTKWTSKLTFHPQYLIQIIQTIRKRLKKEQQKFSILGFSMGGRITLHLTEILHKHIDRVVLVAPDGLKINFWHWFCTHTWLGNKFLGYIVNNGGLVLRMLKLAERTRVVNPTVADFVFYYVQDEAQRQVLYNRWTTLRKFRLHKHKLKRMIVKERLPIRMLFGLQDKIILSSSGRRFRSGIEDFASVRVVNESHYLLQPRHAEIIRELLQG